MSYENELARTRRELQKRNHPKKGSRIKVEPIRKMSALIAIMELLKDHPRNYCLFVLGINTGYRASEILSLRIVDVSDLKIGDGVDIKQIKNKEYRMATVNGIVYDALQKWLALHPNPEPAAPLFWSQRGGAISVSRVWQLVKKWCADVGLRENYGSHSLRKTWGYHQRIISHVDVSLLSRAYGHASETQTFDYLGIQPQEIKNLYLGLELPVRGSSQQRNSPSQEGAISDQLVTFQNDLNSMFSQLEFHCHAMKLLMESSEGEALNSQRQYEGMTNAGLNIAQMGWELSSRFETLRKQIEQ